MGRAGTFRRVSTTGQPVRAFIPRPLPPDPPLVTAGHLDALADAAVHSLGRLDGASLLLPDPDAFLYVYVRKEAVLSSQIEGTQSSLSDLLMAEQGTQPTGLPPGDVEEASRYVAAMNHGVARLADGFPLSLRLIRDVHGVLLGQGRGAARSPGRFRRSQVWIGGAGPHDAVFVPPPPQDVGSAMHALEQFLHADAVAVRPIIKAALAHAQFETIHPFLDGNGRLGRLLITLVLCNEGVLQRPLLYLSLFLRRHRAAYYHRLQAVRTDGDWEGWVTFFLHAVVEVANGALATTRAVIELVQQDRERILDAGRGAASMLRVHQLATRTVLLSPGRASHALGLTPPAVYRAMERLEAMGVLAEVTGRRRGRVYAYAAYLALLQADDGPSGGMADPD